MNKINIKNPLTIFTTSLKTEGVNLIVNAEEVEVIGEEKEEETSTFSISTLSTIYYFPLNISEGIPFRSLDGLYDTTNSVYIQSPGANDYVNLKPLNITLADNISGYPIFGDDLVYPGDFFSTVSTGGSN